MLKQIILCHKINEFYKVCGAYLYNAPAHTTLRDVNDDNFLTDVLYDISEMCDNAPNDKACAWMTALERDIRTYSERKSAVLPTIIAVVIILLIAVSTVGCGVHAEPAHTRYTANGRYYTDGTVITDDGNEWAYSTDTISDKPVYDGMPVSVGFDDNGTPDNIYDDIVLGLVWDINTSVYDELEDALGDKFELTRDGNNIRIGGIR